MDSKTNIFPASRLGKALLCCTVLAGLPIAVNAQESSEPESSATSGSVQGGDIIRTIAVTGSQRLEPETIISYIKMRPGQVYTAELADQALIDLAQTELFADFRIDNNNGNVVITVEENPVINRIVMEGNKRLKNDKIYPEINLSPRQIFTRSKVRADVARIIELYKRQGRFAATVEPQMVMLDQNRVDVIFEISEGPKSKVRRINIIGNSVFSDGELRGEMVTKQDGLLKIISSNTSYDPDRLAFDQQKLRQFYLTQGYADFRVVSAVAELTPDKRDFIITYVVEEGERYKFGEVEVVSQLRDFNSEFLTRSLAMQPGNWYNAELVDNTVESLTETAGTFGYAFADVRPDIQLNREDRTMNVSFTVANAPRVYIESVDINGNTLTQDKVIRREFRLAEGDAFSSLQVRRSTGRINSLGYFQENFELEQVEGSEPDRIRLIANVQEEPTGELSLSAGFSSLESFIFQGSIRQNNFRGRGQSIGLGLNYSRFSRSGNISFTEPKVFDRDIAAGINIYRRDYSNGFFDRDSATYESTETGLSINTGIPLSEYISARASYTLQFQDITVDERQFFSDFDEDGIQECEPLIAGRYLCDAIGNRTQSILGLSLSYNTLNSRVRPTRGHNVTTSLDIAGLGGNTQYVRGRLNAAKYFNVGRGFIGSLSLEGGYIKGFGGDIGDSGDVLLTDRFFLGEGQMRGFDIRGIGPRVVRRFFAQDADGDFILNPFDGENNSDDSLGGNAYYLAKAELEIPLGSGVRELGLRPSLFIDVGAVFDIDRPSLNQNLPSDPIQIPNGVDENGDPVTADFRPFFVEEFVGNTWKPRVAIGIGINWNSPFGPFRIDLAHILVKHRGDETKTLSFNVGTQF